MMKIKYVLPIIILSLNFNTGLGAASLAQFEQDLMQQYYQAEITGGRIEADQYNQQIAEAVETQLKTDPKTFEYNFKRLTDKYMLRIYLSPDHRLKIYNLDVSSGGTMREFQNIMQYKSAGKVHTQVLSELGAIQSIQQTVLGNKTTYIINHQLIGSSCMGAMVISAYQWSANSLREAAVFKTKRKTLSEISVEYDCHKFRGATADGSDYFYNYDDLIHVAANMQTIDIQLMNEQLVPQNKYLRYQKKTNYYQYNGVVPAAQK